MKNKILKSLLCNFLILSTIISPVFAVNLTDLNNDNPVITIDVDGEQYVSGGFYGESYFVVGYDDVGPFLYTSDKTMQEWSKQYFTLPEDAGKIIDAAIYIGRYYLLTSSGDKTFLFSSNDMLTWKEEFSPEIEGTPTEMVAGEMNLFIKTKTANKDIVYKSNPEMHEIYKLIDFKDNAGALIFYKNMFMAASKDYLYLISDMNNPEILISPVEDIIGTKIDKVISYQPMETQCNRSSMYLMYELNGENYTKQIHTSLDTFGWEPMRDTVEYNEKLVKDYSSYTDIVGSWGFPILVVNDDYFYITKMNSNASPLKCDVNKIEWAWVYDEPSSWAIMSVRETAEDLILTPATVPYDYTANITRKDFAIYVYNLMKNHLQFTNEELINPFSDTDCKEIIALRKADIILGTSDTTFSPDKTLTRAEAATILSRIHQMFGRTIPNDISGQFYKDDADIPEWAKDAIYYAKSIGVMGGYDDNTFGASDPYTYEQSLVTLNRLSDIVWKGDPPTCTTCTNSESNTDA